MEQSNSPSDTSADFGSIGSFLALPLLPLMVKGSFILRDGSLLESSITLYLWSVDLCTHPVVIPIVWVDQHDLTYVWLTHNKHELEVLLLLQPAVHGNRLALSRIFPRGQFLGNGFKLPGWSRWWYSRFWPWKFGGILFRVITTLIFKALAPSLAVRPDMGRTVLLFPDSWQGQWDFLETHR